MFGENIGNYLKKRRIIIPRSFLRPVYVNWPAISKIYITKLLIFYIIRKSSEKLVTPLLQTQLNWPCTTDECEQAENLVDGGLQFLVGSDIYQS
jgi:hypothetical protein